MFADNQRYRVMKKRFVLIFILVFASCSTSKNLTERQSEIVQILNEARGNNTIVDGIIVRDSSIVTVRRYNR